MGLTSLTLPTKITCESFSIERRCIRLTSDTSRAQQAVLTKKFGLQKIFCVVGFSMGGQQVDSGSSFKDSCILIMLGIPLGDYVPGSSGKVLHTITIVGLT